MGLAPEKASKIRRGWFSSSWLVLPALIPDPVVDAKRVVTTPTQDLGSAKVWRHRALSRRAGLKRQAQALDK